MGHTVVECVHYLFVIPVRTHQKKMSTPDLSSMTPQALRKLVKDAKTELEKKMQTDTCTVQLYVGTYTIVLTDVDISMTIRDLKENVEEQFFKVKKNTTVSGPSAKCRYICTSDGDEAVDTWPLRDYVDDEEDTAFFTVREPKKRSRSNLEESVVGGEEEEKERDSSKRRKVDQQV